MVVHVFNPSIWEAKAGSSVWISGQSDLQSKFQDNQGYAEQSCLKNQKPTKKSKTLKLENSIESHAQSN